MEFPEWNLPVSSYARIEENGVLLIILSTILIRKNLPNFHVKWENFLLTGGSSDLEAKIPSVGMGGYFKKFPLKLVALNCTAMHAIALFRFGTKWTKTWLCETVQIFSGASF